MKVAIIGCGNMGGAIARGLAADAVFAEANVVAVSNRSEEKLRRLQQEYPGVEVSVDNQAVAAGADVLLIAVKPWLVDVVAEEIRPQLRSGQLVVSIAAGVPFSRLAELFSVQGAVLPLFRVIPNTAIAIGESMTVISSLGTSAEQECEVSGLFGRFGKTQFVEERLMAAGAALCSCGTAYALRYIRAAMEGGVELGFPPDQAKEIVAQTLKGAADLLLSGGLHPEAEIDKVTTPGGLTIKGLNRMEACGFTTAVIEGLKASLC